MSTEQNKAIVHRFYEEVWEKGNAAVCPSASPAAMSSGSTLWHWLVSAMSNAVASIGALAAPVLALRCMNFILPQNSNWTDY
jgi:hypothetical protein